MKCPACGATVADNAAFCQACGKPLAAKAAAQAAAAARPSRGKQAFSESVVNRRQGGDGPDQIVWEGSYSKLAMIGAWVAAGAGTLAAAILGLAAGWDAKTWGTALAVVAVAWLALLVRLIYMQLSVHYTLTRERFLHESGLLWRKQDRIETIDIDDVSVVQGPVQRMLGVGTVRITSTDRSTPEFVLAGIGDVRQVAAMIDEMRRNERRKRGVHIESI
jgi:membrane protein YdbS with pleckstrin-like domain